MLESGKCYVTDREWIVLCGGIPLSYSSSIYYLPMAEKAIKIDKYKIEYCENVGILHLGSVISEFDRKEFDKLLKLYNTFLTSVNNIINK